MPRFRSVRSITAAEMHSQRARINIIHVIVHPAVPCSVINATTSLSALQNRKAIPLDTESVHARLELLYVNQPRTVLAVASEPGQPSGLGVFMGCGRSR